MISENSIVKLITSIDGKINLSVISKKSIQSYSIKIFDATNNIVFSKTNELNLKVIDLNFSIQHVQIWQLSRPYLYRYELDLGFEVIKENFGFRKIGTTKKYVTLNDTPIFVRGYIRGIEAHDHKNNCNLSEEDFYRKNIKTAKEFGFNLVRFHSTVPSETFFKVADEEGILVHIEMRPPNDGYNNVLEMVESRHDFVNKEFIVYTINSLYNHPSLVVLCLGNEFKNLAGNGTIFEIGKMIKEMDPTRLYLDTCAWGENNRPLVDLDVQHMSYYFPFGKHAEMYDDTKNLQIGNFNKGKEIVFNVPLIAHEVCHYTALRDFKNLKLKFKENKINAPWWVDEELKMIHLKGFDERYPLMYKASKSFQRNCWKIAYEAMRSSKLLGGFMFLQLADTDKYENSNGIIDCFDDINGIKPEEFAIFNGDILLLSKIRKFNYFDSETLNFDVFISRFDEQKLNSGKLVVKLGNNVKEFDNVDISKHDFYKIISTSFNLETVSKKTKSILSLELYSEEILISKNEYSIWVYPALKKISYADFISIENDEFVVTSSFEKVFDSLAKKKDVILLYNQELTRHVAHKDMKLPKYSFKASWNRFKPVIWDRGTNFGGLIDNISLDKYGFKDQFLDLDFSIISEDSDKIILDDFPCKTMNLISGIDKCNRDRFDAYKNSFNLPELMYDRTLRDFSYLFMTNVNGNKLLVCGLNLKGLDEYEPSSTFMAKTLIELLRDLDISKLDSISIEMLIKYSQNCAEKPVKERMMTQFWELDDAPVESKQFWEESRNYLK